jgi:hypothetical protein
MDQEDIALYDDLCDYFGSTVPVDHWFIDPPPKRKSTHRGVHVAQRERSYRNQLQVKVEKMERTLLRQIKPKGTEDEAFIKVLRESIPPGPPYLPPERKTKALSYAEIQCKVSSSTSKHEQRYWQGELHKAYHREQAFNNRIKVNQTILDLEHRLRVMDDLLNKFTVTTNW